MNLIIKTAINKKELKMKILVMIFRKIYKKNNKKYKKIILKYLKKMIYWKNNKNKNKKIIL